MKKFITVFLLLMMFAVLVIGCSPKEVEVIKEVIETVEVEKIVVETVVVEVEPEMGEAPAVEVPFLDAWLSSGHADAEAEAFVHWDGDDPAEVPASCAKCHSQYGYHDFLGLDGTEAGVVDGPAEIGSTVTCVTCHNLATVRMDSVVMPSGLELTGLGGEARCMQCHQGRSSKLSVDESILAAGVEDDAISEELGFINIHYYAAAATKYGTFAKGGYEYDGKSYDGVFEHVEGVSSCIDCHSPHTLQVKTSTCETCHTDADLKDIRMRGSAMDYDGDGDMSEGVYYEIAGLQEALYAALQSYAAETAGTAIVYDSHAYPYFFIDTDEDGAVSEGEGIYPNKYASWTPRLLKAAYNYQVSLKDPGAFAHGGKYIIQLLYDSIEDLGGDVSSLYRTDAGHFASSEEAFRHWDEDGAVPASCSKCHSSEGLPLFLEAGATLEQPVSGSLECATCHNDLTEYTLYEVASVEFPSGAVVTSEDPVSNLCMNCHQGRASGLSIAGAIAGKDLDAPDENLRFINIHYFAAGATLYGSEVTAAYEYEGMEYAGLNPHVNFTEGCASCHSAHKLSVKFETCETCHGDFASVEELRAGTIGADIDVLAELVYEAMLVYAADTVGTAIVYDSHAYPYFFTDLNGDGMSTPDEANYGNQYAAWTPRLLRAAYNYQYALKDPGAFAHNGTYIAQVLYDTLMDLDGSYEGFERP